MDVEKFVTEYNEQYHSKRYKRGDTFYDMLVDIVKVALSKEQCTCGKGCDPGCPSNHGAPDPIRLAVEKYVESYLGPRQGYEDQFELEVDELLSIIRAEVKREQNGIIKEFRKRTSTVQQQARHFHADEIENIIRIRQGGE